MIDISTIIPTVGRATLQRAINSVLRQEADGARWELIVVNDCGAPLPAPAEWQDDPRVRIVQTQRRNRCVARNTGAAIARGRYLHFLDDDDWLLPGAWKALLEAAGRTPQAVCLYGGVHFVDREDNILGTFDLQKDGSCLVETLAAVWIPLQASLIRAAAFFELGGFDQTMPAAEDLDFSRRLAVAGDFTAVRAPVAALLRGEEWGSVSANHLTLEYNRRGRDRLLEQPGALARLIADTGDASYFHGRILHAYLAGMRLNLVQRRPLTAASRFFHALFALALSGKRLLDRRYWQALREDTIMHRLVDNQSPRYRSVAEWLR